MILTDHLNSFTDKAELARHIREDHKHPLRFEPEDIDRNTLGFFKDLHLWHHDRSAVDGTRGPNRLAEQFRVDL